MAGTDPRTVRACGRDGAGPGLQFSREELRDLAVAWVALGLAFAFFLRREIARSLLLGQLPEGVLATLGLSMATVGVGFLLHELAHKVVAVRLGRVAEFRADYGMLAVAIGSGLAGFIFAAPGAVYHGGRSITPAENGRISLAGPATNLLLAAAFAPLLAVEPLYGAAQLGVSVNCLLAAFNMLPFGPLDGRSVLAWSKGVFAAAFVVSLGAAAAAVLYVGTGF